MGKRMARKVSEKQKLKTLEKAIGTMREKIEEQIPVMAAASLSQEVTLGSGETVLRSNPEVSEFRALVKDYTAALKAYKEMTGENTEKEKAVLADIRTRFKVAK